MIPHLRRWSWLALACGILGASRARASTVTVPDAFPTVQAAIDSGVDTVLIREGSYPEVPQANRGVTLRGIGTQRPQLGGLAISNPYSFMSRRWEVNGIDFAGRIEISTFNADLRYIEITISDCTLRMGLQHVLNTDSNDIAFIGISRCVLAAACAARARNVIMDSDTVDVGVRWAARDSIRVEHCWFRGWSGPALYIAADDVAGVIANNLMEDCTTGIHGIGFDGVSIISNTIRRMRDAGIEMTGAFSVVRDNYIEGCGVGIRSYQSGVELHDNAVLHSQGTGMWFAQPDVLRLEDNVVGLAEGPAVAVLVSDNADLTFIRNTLFKSLVSGLDFMVSVNSRIVVQNNIGFANGGWGLKLSLPQESVVLACNDWYANGLGSVSGAPVSPDDFDVDPLFCHLANADVSLAANSPLVTQTTCGQIGAKSVGCSVTPTTLSRLSVTAEWNGLAIRWGFAVGDRAACWIERAEHDTGPWDSLGTGTRTSGSEFELRDNEVVPGRTYFYRVSWSENGAIVHSAPVSGRLSDAGPLTAVTPNPSSGEVSIGWTLASPADAEVRVFDLAGREVAVVAKGRFPAGRHNARWDSKSAGGSPARAGWYIVRVTRGGDESSHRVLLIR